MEPTKYSVEPITSERLELVAMTPAFLKASLNQDLHQAGDELKALFASEWPGDAADLLALRLEQIEAEPAVQPWLLRAIVLRTSRTMVGYIGFHTAPNPEYLRDISPGAVEFGFTVFPEFRRQGFAREASIALMDWAATAHKVQRFIMSIRPDNHPSQNLALQLNFVRIGSHIDEVDGLEEILELRVPNGDSDKTATHRRN